MLAISVTNGKQNKQFEHGAGPLEFGRIARGPTPRLVIDDGFVSRDHVRVEELPGGRLAVTNLSARNPILLADGAEITANQTRELILPTSFIVGQTSIVIRNRPDSAARVGAAALEPTPAPVTAPAPPTIAPEGNDPGDVVRERSPAASPGQRDADAQFAADGYLSIQPVRRPRQESGVRGQEAEKRPLNADARLLTPDSPPSPETLARWMETVLALQRSDASPAEFYTQAARSMIDMIGLDVGLVLLHGEKGWRVTARAAREGDDDAKRQTSAREFSQTVLAHILDEKQTFYQDLDRMRSQQSLRSVGAVVASPIFGLQDEVVGALYGLRRGRDWTRSVKVTPLEAQLVQLLAAAVGANLARTTATRTRTQFEQFFSPELARELARDPAMLEGRGQEVTILMSDLRGFSTLSERLGPADTCRLVRDVMERLSERIVQQTGVIVSYLGDGVLSMWNAPARQENHAVLACRAALAIQAELPGLNAAWAPIVGGPLHVGVGVNTGPAQVGNTGSSRKFWYGPLGNTVNLASRVEGATKHLNVPILITGSTRAQIGDGDAQFAVRRLCQARLVGIQGAVDLYELHGETASPEWLADRDLYEKALRLYESGQWLKACQTLLPLLERGDSAGATAHFDVPTLKLMNRAWACLENPPEPAIQFDPVLELSTK
jgi:adenylate cyclase